MTTFDADGITLRKIRDGVWELPKEGDMRAPARVYASEALLEEISDDKTLQQLRNSTHLPGMTGYAVCMPDGHQGYGFPVGGVGATDAEEGCISPGAIGYDINCLHGEMNVLLEHGRTEPIESLVDTFEDERAVVAADDTVPSRIRLATETPNEEVFEVRTVAGDTVRATADHPFGTPDGLTELDELSSGDEVFVHHFEGLPNEAPPEFTVVDETDFEASSDQLIAELQERELLPLRSNDEQFYRLLKLVGYHTGDGAIGAEGQTWFYGDPTDLKTIQEDIRAIGFEPSKVYSRDRTHDIEGNEFERTEYSVRSGSRAFQQLLLKLGAPDGPKVESRFELLDYFDRLATWQQALYASAYFGAEMSTPAAQHAKNLYCPEVTQTRAKSCEAAGREFIEGIQHFLEQIGVETNPVERLETDSNERVDTVRFRLRVKNDSENLIRLFTNVGYRYNHEKQREAMAAVEYLKRKEKAIERRELIAEEAKAMADGGTPVAEICSQFDINDRFIQRSVWSGRDGRPRPPSDFPDYQEFRERTTVRDDHTIETTIDEIEAAGTATVYDIGVRHDAHTFLANGFVVSNCGVRMMTTNLTYDDLQGREEELVDALFANVPAGLGGGGIVETDRSTMDEILDRGVEWAVENGHGVEADLRRCEDEGRRPDARPEFVSQKAKDRGANQVGSLGSGNHFLEVQRVTDIYRDDIAETFGLEEDRIVVLIHCGSRGLGHQTCNDYLREIETAHKGLLDRLPDKELAAAPAGSQLAEEYYGAMCAAINFAWVNRQLIMHRTRRVFEQVFDRSWEDMEMELLYDVAHNIGKKEVHEVGVDETGTAVTPDRAVDTEQRELYVHRKGATRAFPAGREEVPAAYRDVGQPVIIPGSMGAGSYVLVGGDQSLEISFGSTAHGAGRLMSRTQAKNEYWGGDVQDDLRDDNQIYVKAESGATIAEEAPGVYKDVDEVVSVSDKLGIGDKVARTYPVCNIKG